MLDSTQLLSNEPSSHVSLYFNSGVDYHFSVGQVRLRVECLEKEIAFASPTGRRFMKTSAALAHVADTSLQLLQT